MAGNDTFRTHRKASNFTMVQNELINSFELSWAAKGMLIYLLSKPDGWKVYTGDIIKHATNGKDSVKSLTKELRAAGYITLTRIVNAKGRVQEWRYDVYDEPIECPVETYLTVRLFNTIEDMAAYPDLYECGDIDSALEAQHEDEHNAATPEADFPDVENPDAGKTPTSNIDLINIDSTNIQSIPAGAGKIDGVVCVEKEYGDIIETIKRNIEYSILCQRKEYSQWLEQWLFLIADCLAGKDRVYIGGTPVPKQIAKERMFMLNDYHFLQVKESISKVTHPIRNAKNYIFTSLFNIVTTGDDALINEIQTAEQEYIDSLCSY